MGEGGTGADGGNACMGWTSDLTLFKTGGVGARRGDRTDFANYFFLAGFLIFSSLRTNPLARAANACEMGNGDLDSITPLIQ